MRARFDDVLSPRPRPRWHDVETRLDHFALVTYAVDPARLRPLVHPRYDLDLIAGADGRARALISMVPFQDRDFHYAGMPWPRWSFGQTNYRAYVIDKATGRRLAWFFGTTLGSWTVAVPRLAWKLPWHGGDIRFDCAYSETERRYTRYKMATRSAWAPAELELEDTGEAPKRLDGFDDLEKGLVVLTHPLEGVFYRRDGILGGYSVWHDRLALTGGRIRSVRCGLFESLGLVPLEEQQRPHSVLIQRSAEFLIRLPPSRLRDD